MVDTSSVVDIRPDRFLRAMRDTGDVEKSCGLAGLTPEEYNQICRENPKFDLAAVECFLEFTEESFQLHLQKVIDKARYDMQESLKSLRAKAMADYRARHG